MWSVLELVLPLFGLILVGWSVGRSGYIGMSAGQALSQFAFKIAMPALLFRVTLNASWSGDPVLLAFAFFGSIAAVWVIAVCISRVLLRQSGAESTVTAMGSCFGNSAMLGLPLALTAFGEEAQAPITVIITLDTPILWLLGTLQMETIRARRSQTTIDVSALAAVARDIATNPIVVALILGTAGRAAGLTLPPLADRSLALLQQAALPTALVALGISICNFKLTEHQPSIGLILLLKMIVLPLVVFAVTTGLDLPPTWIGTATLLAAMPVGANAYLFATRYGLGGGAMAGTVAVSTACAVFTSSLVLLLLTTVTR